MIRAFPIVSAVVFCAAGVAPQMATAQDQVAFETGLGECVQFVTADPATPWAFPTSPATLDTDESGTDASVVYPVGSAGNYDFAVSFSHTFDTSTTPGSRTCGGAGPKSPLWPQFDITGWIGADARLRGNGLVELNFPGPQRAYADCTAETPDVFMIFNAGPGDRVVFSATTGPSAGGFCSSMGWKG